ncbi:metallophosphoesterase [Salinarimonas rosea]|uniref:metallophosphoesterase n=1 Tax=Salinarimonas rosea TaxID=552063 RepID=UPI0005BE04B7|nr:metallophosphoesterase [Salinarimonas rosea]
MLVAHISDLHVPASGEPVPGAVDVNAALHKAFTALQALSPRPDLVIVSGDVADAGRARAYRRAAEMLKSMRRSVVAVPGNHDDPTAFAAFLRLIGGESRLPAPDLCSVRDFTALRVVGLASNLPYTSAGGLDDAQLDWLDATLTDAPARPTLIAVHHPPFRCGIGFMDRIRLVEGAARLECIVAAHPQVLAVLCGHHHRAMETLFGGRPCYVAPSLAYGVSLDMRPGGDGGLAPEPAAYRLLHYDGRRLVSHLAFVESAGAARPFRLAEVAGARA